MYLAETFQSFFSRFRVNITYQKKFSYFDEFELISLLIYSKHPLIMVLLGLLLQINSDFCFLRFNSNKKYSLSWSIHDEFIDLEGEFLPDVQNYTFSFAFLVKSIALSKISCKIVHLGMKNQVCFGNHQQIDFISNHFSEKLTLQRVNVNMTNYDFFRVF